MSDLTSKTALELRDLFLSKQVSATEITRNYLNRIDKYDEAINSFISRCDNIALETAEKLDAKLASLGTKTTQELITEMGILAGAPIAVKDLINLKGTETTAGSKMLAGYRSSYNATITDKVLSAGAIPIGKANLDEFAMGSSNENSAYGVVHNPWDYSRVPGGSSGGSAAAVAARFAPLAFGTDTGGSIRQPASYCGIVGLKPTYGRVSRYGIVAFASSLDQAGPMTHSVRDAALLMEAMAGHDAKDSTSIKNPVPNYINEIENSFGKTQSLKGMRLGIAPEFFDSSSGLNPEVKKAVEKAIKHFESLGAKTVEIKLNKTKYGLPCYYVIAPSEASSNLSRYDGVRFGHRDKEADNLLDLYLQSRTKFGDEVKRRIMIGVYALSSGYYDAYYNKALKVRRLIAQDFDAAFDTCDFIVSPTAPSTAFKLGEIQDPLTMYLADIYTVQVNLAGLPAISFNCGYDSAGLPIGMQLIAPVMAESRLLNAAYAFESTTDYSKAPELEANMVKV